MNEKLPTHDDAKSEAERVERMDERTALILVGLGERLRRDDPEASAALSVLIRSNSDNLARVEQLEAEERVEEIECPRCEGTGVFIPDEEDPWPCVTCNETGKVYSYAYSMTSTGGVSAVVEVVGYRKPSDDWAEHQLKPEVSAVAGLLLDRGLRIAKRGTASSEELHD